MSKVLDIIGPYPPPLGGISIHISRIETYLKKEGIAYRIYNHGHYSSPTVIATNKSAFWYLKYLVMKKGSLIHFHQFFLFHYFYYFVFGFVSKTKIIATIHEENILNYKRFLQSIVIFLLRHTNFVELISVSQKLSEFLNQHGIRNTFLPAYVPPVAIGSSSLSKKDGKEYFLYSIWKLDREIAGSIYNIDLAFRLLSKIKDRYHMLFLVGTERESDKNYLNELLNKYGVADNVTVFFEHPLIDYLNNCKFLLRTNNVDGYGVSLQEALDLKVPAIASDVCTRPRGTILFKKDDLDDLLQKVINIKSYWDEASIEVPNFHIRLIEMYKKHLENK